MNSYIIIIIIIIIITEHKNKIYFYSELGSTCWKLELHFLGRQIIDEMINSRLKTVHLTLQ